MATGAEALVRALERAGAGVVFGVAGPHNVPIVAQLRAQGVRFVGMQTGPGAVQAASGYAGRTGRPSVALTGPSASALPLLSALEEARASGSPVILVISPRESLPVLPRLPQRDPAPQPGAVGLADVLRGMIHLGAEDDVAAKVRQARDLARTAPGGPVALQLAPGMLTAVVAPEPEDLEAHAEPTTAPRASVEHVQLRRAANLVDASQNLLIWAGGGALRAGAGGAVAELAEKVGAPVLTTVHAAGLLPARHPCLIGLPPHLPAVGALWDGADVVVAIGTDFDAESTQGRTQPPPDSLIAINVDPVDAGRTYSPEVLLRGDARTLTKALVDAVSYRGGTAVVRSRLDDVRSGVSRQLETSHTAELAFVAAVSDALPDRTTVVVDPCAAGRWLAAFHEWTLPRTLLFPSDIDTVGAALATAIGAGTAGSTEPVVALMGDQGLLASLGELAVLSREKLPLTLVVVDDGGSGRLRPLLEEMELDPTALDRPSPDFAAIARAMGMRADTLDVIGSELTEALRAHIAAPDPTMLVVQARLGPPPTDRFRWYRAFGRQG